MIFGPFCNTFASFIFGRMNLIIKHLDLNWLQVSLVYNSSLSCPSESREDSSSSLSAPYCQCIYDAASFKNRLMRWPISFQTFMVAKCNSSFSLQAVCSRAICDNTVPNQVVVQAATGGVAYMQCPLTLWVQGEPHWRTEGSTEWELLQDTRFEILQGGVLRLWVRPCFIL